MVANADSDLSLSSANFWRREKDDLDLSERPATGSLAEYVFRVASLASSVARSGLLAGIDNLRLELAVDSVGVGQLLRMGDVSTARNLLARGRRSSESWARLLEPPTVTRRVASAAPGFEANYGWLRAHADEYAGRWVALRGGTLLGDDTRRARLHRRLEGQGSLAGVLFVKVD